MKIARCAIKSLKNDGNETRYDKLVHAPAGAVALRGERSRFGMPGEQPVAGIFVRFYDDGGRLVGKALGNQNRVA